MSLEISRKPRIFNAKHNKLAIVASKYNEVYSDGLVDNAIEELSELLPQARVDLIRVPGAFEIPVVIKSLLELEQPICAIALGVIIQGETAHADLVARSVIDALQQLSLDYTTPVINEVLLVADEAQAHVRCLGDELNRGTEAARAATAMVEIFSELDRGKSLRTQPRDA